MIAVKRTGLVIPRDLFSCFYVVNRVHYSWDTETGARFEGFERLAATASGRLLYDANHRLSGPFIH